jgi:hypothetical protein
MSGTVGALINLKCILVEPFSFLEIIVLQSYCSNVGEHRRIVGMIRLATAFRM